MIPYNARKPLIYIHVPKTAGISVRLIFESWFGTGLLRHYYDESAARMPVQRDWTELQQAKSPICLYGHFNSRRGFGVADYYPQCRQFITLLRDPFDQALSRYFYVSKVGKTWRDKTRVPNVPLDEFVLNTRPNMLNQFPLPITRDNYRDVIEQHFVMVGLTEHLSESIGFMAEKLHMPVPDTVPLLNRTDRGAVATDTDLRARFVSRYALEWEVYQYCKQRFFELRA